MKLKKIIFSSVLLACVSTAFAAMPSTTVEVIATVNNYPILNTQVIQQAGPNATLTMQKTALKNIIDNYLINQYIAKYNLKVPPAQVNSIVESIAKRNHMSLSSFYAELQISGVSKTEFLHRIKTHMMTDIVRNLIIKQNIHLKPAEVLALGQKLYNTAKLEGTLPNTKSTQYLASDILIKVTPVLDSAQAETKLKKIRNEIMAGKYTFSQAAIKYSEDYGSVANNGSLGWAFPQAYIPTFAKVLVSTPVGKISMPFPDRYGWQMLQVVATKKVSVDKDVFIGKAYAKLYDAKAAKLAKNWQALMRSKADIVYVNSMYK